MLLDLCLVLSLMFCWSLPYPVLLCTSPNAALPLLRGLTGRQNRIYFLGVLMSLIVLYLCLGSWLWILGAFTT